VEYAVKKLKICFVTAGPSDVLFGGFVVDNHLGSILFATLLLFTFLIIDLLSVKEY